MKWQDTDQIKQNKTKKQWQQMKMKSENVLNQTKNYKKWKTKHYFVNKTFLTFFS